MEINIRFIITAFIFVISLSKVYANNQEIDINNPSITAVAMSVPSLIGHLTVATPVAACPFINMIPLFIQEPTSAKDRYEYYYKKNLYKCNKAKISELLNCPFLSRLQNTQKFGNNVAIISYYNITCAQDIDKKIEIVNVLEKKFADCEIKKYSKEKDIIINAIKSTHFDNYEIILNILNDNDYTLDDLDYIFQGLKFLSHDNSIFIDKKAFSDGTFKKFIKLNQNSNWVMFEIKYKIYLKLIEDNYKDEEIARILTTKEWQDVYLKKTTSPSQKKKKTQITQETTSPSCKKKLKRNSDTITGYRLYAEGIKATYRIFYQDWWEEVKFKSYKNKLYNSENK